MHTNYSNRHKGGSRHGNSLSRRQGPRSRRPFPEKKIDVSRYINTTAAPYIRETYSPQHRFVDFAVDERLKRNILAKGYDSPTPIQDKTIPEILSGKDVIGIANTGTGKTAAFLIPLIDKVMKGKWEQILVLTPTRELAIQITDELATFTTSLSMHSVCAVGGTPIGRQISELRHFNSFVIGTPGRVKDLVNRGTLRLDDFKTVVLDEADRMLDMGFVGDMRLLLSLMPKNRQTLFFSATFSPEIESLTGEFLHQPVRLSVKTGDTASSIHQQVVKTDGRNKIDVLHDLLSNEELDKVLVFGRTKHGVQKLSDALARRGFASAAIHGNKNQSQRQRALLDFKTNRARILVATDVAARGLDIPNVSHVINFDIPATHEDYIHRIGRTGRGDKTGKALTFID